MSAVYDFFAQPVPVLGFALCRLLLGLVLVVDGLRMLADHDRWYGPGALRPRTRLSLPRWMDLFTWLPSKWVFRLMVLSALAFALGVLPKFAGAVLLLTLIAIPPRNMFIVYGGDAFARTLVLLLLFAPCDAALNLGRAELGLDAVAPPWGGRLVQVEIVLLYLYNFFYKAADPAWKGRTALFDLFRNRNFARESIPGLLKGRRLSGALSWAALHTELLLPIGLVVSPTATVTCCVAVAFHLGIAWCIDVHLFSFIMIAGLAAWLPFGGETTIAAAPLDLTTGVAFVLCLAYAAFAVLADLPHGGRISRAVRDAAAPLLRRIYWERGWQLFVESCRHEYQLEITTIDEEGEASRCTWDRRDHRTQRFKFAAIRSKHARDVFVAHIRSLLPARTRALSIDAFIIDVRSRHVVGALHIGAQVADLETCALLAAAVRAEPTRAMLAEVSEGATP